MHSTSFRSTHPQHPSGQHTLHILQVNTPFTSFRSTHPSHPSGQHTLHILQVNTPSTGIPPPLNTAWQITTCTIRRRHIQGVASPVVIGYDHYLSCMVLYALYNPVQDHFQQVWSMTLTYPGNLVVWRRTRQSIWYKSPRV